MLRKNFLKSIFALIVFSLSLITVRAIDFALRIENPEKSTFAPKSEVRIPVKVEKIYRHNFLMPFKFRLDYNHNIFSFKKFECNSPFSENDFKTEEKDSSLNILSNFQKIKKLNFKDKKYFDLGYIVLLIKDGAPCGVHNISSEFNLNDKNVKSSAQINVSSNGNSSLPPEIIKNQKNKSGCKLKSITPEIGTLSPSFDPNIFEYSIDVGKNVEYMDLKAEPQERDSIVKISRRKLEAAGSATTIRITVSNKNDRTIYIVKVNRDAKSNSISNKKPGKSSGKKGSHKKKNSEYGDDFGEEDIDENEDENETENKNNSENEIIKNENNNQKIYLIIILSTVMLVVIGYFTYEFIKYKRKNSKNTKNSLNKPLK